MANGEIYDVTVIGSGPGGYVAAIRAAQSGLKTAVVERDPAGTGGTCLLRGCIPTKALLHTADLLEDMQKAKEFGIKAEGIELDFPALMSRKDRIVKRLTKGIESYLFKKNKITLLRGQGRLEGPKAVVVEGESGEKKVQTKNVILATGSHLAWKRKYTRRSASSSVSQLPWPLAMTTSASRNASLNTEEVRGR